MSNLYGNMLAHHKWLPFINKSGETIEAWLPLLIDKFVQIDGRIGFEVKKPNENWRPFYAISGPGSIEPDGQGVLTLDIGKPIFLNVPESDEIDRPGAVMGVTKDEWSVQAGLNGFRGTGLRVDGLLFAWQYAVNLIQFKWDLATAVPPNGSEVPVYSLNETDTLQKVDVYFDWASDDHAAKLDSEHWAACYHRAAAESPAGVDASTKLRARWLGGEAK